MQHAAKNQTFDASQHPSPKRNHITHHVSHTPLTKILTLFLLLILGASNVWGDETATITFSSQTSGTSDGNTAYTTSNFVNSGIASTDATFGTITCSATSKCYSGKIGYGMKVGASSNTGNFTLSFSKSISSVTKITLNCASYSASNKPSTITIKNGNTTLGTYTTSSSSADFSDAIINNLSIASLNTLTIETSKYCYIKSISITYSTKTLTSLTVTGTPSQTIYEAGDAFDPAGLVVTGTYDDESKEDLTSKASWTYDYGTGYTALVAGASSVGVTATVGTVSSEKTTISGLTVKAAAKTLIGIEVTGTPAEFWKGDTFNHDGVVVTATWDDESKTDVTSESTFSTPDMTTAGEKPVTVTYKGEETSYKINVKTIANTQETAYTITEAIAKHTAGKDLTTQVYVKGTVSAITTAWSDQYNNITYAISEDGKTTSTQFLLFRCTTNGAAVGDDVIACGTLATYNKVVQLAAGNSITSITKATTLSIADIAVKKGKGITPVITTNIVGDYTISYSSNNENVVLADGNELVTGDSTGTATITATISATGYKTAVTTFTVTVTSAATLSSITISGDLTKSTYTVGDEFDFSGLSATGNYSDETHADLTSIVAWTVEPATLTAATTSVTVQAKSGEITGTKDYNITVNKKASSITIENMEIGKTDANVPIVAETTPAEAALTYEITEGSEYITLSKGKISAVAPGTATIKASYAGTDEYAAAETTFTVTVSNLNKAVKNGFTTGDNSGSHNFTDNTDISFEAFKGSADTAPALPSGTTYLRLYQNGGYIKISGVKGVKIQSVKLTTGSKYASTTVGYCVDNGDAPTTGESVAKSSDYTISSLNNQSVSIYCLGTNKDTRLDIAALEVKYTKEVVTLSSISVSGEYTTKFIQNQEFNHTGAEVTATFSDEDQQVVTSEAEFSTPDMTTTGEKTVTVSYTHEGVTKETSYTINVSAEVATSISLSGTYQTAFHVGDAFTHEGAIVTATYNSKREAIVTDDAIFSSPDMTTEGTKTVTVTYGPVETTYTIKVLSAATIFYESFDTNNTQGGNDGNWSQGSGALTSDNTGWIFTKGSGANKCAKFGTGSDKGSAQTPSITITGNAKITFKAGAWNGNSESLGLTLSTTSGTLSESSVTLTKAAWTEYTVYVYGVAKSTQITFAASTSNNNRFFLDEVLVEKSGPRTFDLTVGSAGIATLGLPYAVSIPDSAYIYTAAVDGKQVTMTRQNVKDIPANTGVVVKAAAGKYTFTEVASSSTEITNNKLVAAVSEYKETADNSLVYYLGLEESKVVFINLAKGGTIPQYKAYLKLDSKPSSGKLEVTFDEEPSGIESITDIKTNTNTIYNLQGVPVNENYKGVVIKNGKKYFNK